MSQNSLHPDFLAVPASRIAEVNLSLDERVAHTGFDQLASLYQEQGSDVTLPPPGSDTRVRLRAILGFTASHLNLREFQGGVERRRINWNDVPYLDASELNAQDSPLWRRVNGVAESFGMVHSTNPPLALQSGEHVVVAPGATDINSLHRIERSIGRRLSPQVEPGQVIRYGGIDDQAHPLFSDPNALTVLLGSKRLLPDYELAVVDSFAPGARTEFEMMRGGLLGLVGGEYAERRYDIGDPGYDPAPGEQAALHEFIAKGTGHRILALEVPNPMVAERSGRAQTEHSYMLLRRVLRNEVSVGTPVTNVTNQRYVPFQHDVGLRELLLPDRWAVETVGFGTVDESMGELPPVQFLPEIHSHAFHLNALRVALDRVSASIL